MMAWPMERTRDSKVQDDLMPGDWQSGFLGMRAGLRSQQTAIAAFLVLGCVFRIIRYAQNFPLWSDECFLSVNFIDRGYRELLEPLDIPYAAMSETSANCWKFSVINEASCWEYLVDKPSRTSWMAA